MRDRETSQPDEPVHYPNKPKYDHDDESRRYGRRERDEKYDDDDYDSNDDYDGEDDYDREDKYNDYDDYDATDDDYSNSRSHRSRYRNNVKRTRTNKNHRSNQQEQHYQSHSNRDTKYGNNNIKNNAGFTNHFGSTTLPRYNLNSNRLNFGIQRQLQDYNIPQQQPKFNNFNTGFTYYDTNQLSNSLLSPYRSIHQQNYNRVPQNRPYVQGGYQSRSYFNRHINFDGGQLYHVPNTDQSDVTSFELHFDTPGIFSSGQPSPIDYAHGAFGDAAGGNDGSFVLGYGVVTP